MDLASPAVSGTSVYANGLISRAPSNTTVEFVFYCACFLPDLLKYEIFLISNFRRVLSVVCFLLGNSPASEFYMPTFRNTLSLPSS